MKTLASGSMGKGFAIKPSDMSSSTAPFSRNSTSNLLSTRHAIGLESDNGIMLLIHVGIDTVKLRGTGFISYF